jgi:hypothetical protein
MKTAGIYMGAAALALFLIYAFFSDGEGFYRIGVIAAAGAIGYALLSWSNAETARRKRDGKPVKYWHDDHGTLD